MIEEKISNEEMASYMNMIFNSNELNNSYCQNPKSADLIFQNVGNIIAKYYISTGDNSFESAKRIIDEYLNYGDEENFFQEHFMPIIEERVSQNLSMDSNNLSLEDRIKIQEYVDVRNKNNLFYTHCFPGVLFEEISTNGLDISKELFKDEYETLSTCFKTSFKTGELNYCELSSASLSYATLGIPERVKYAIGGIKDLSNKESIHDVCAKSFDENLQREYERGKIDYETMEKMKQAGTKIIDFYAKGKSGIAFFRKDDQTKQKESYMRSKLIRNFSDFGKGLKNTILGSIIDNAINEANKKPEQAFEIYEQIFKEIIDIYPDASKGINEFVDKILAENMSKYAINNYEYGGFADGYSVESGKMLPNEFAISTFITPREVTVRNQIQNRAINSEKKTKKADKLNPLNMPSCYNDMKKNILFLDKNFKKAIEMSPRPEMIELIAISKKRNLMVTTIDGDKRVVGYTLAARNNQGNIYYNFTGNINDAVKDKMYFELENLELEKKKKIIEEFKEFDSEYSDDIEEDAMCWYVDQQYKNMSEEKKERLKEEVLESHGKLIVFERDGRTIISPLENNVLTKEYSGEVIYSKDSKGKYNKFFERIRSEKMQSVDELGKQVLQEIKDVESLDSVNRNINLQTKEIDSSKKEAK